MTTIKLPIKIVLTLAIIAISSMYATNFAYAQKSIYDYTVKTIDGKDFSMKELKGKKVMIVNVASKCGLTPQYKQLQELYTEYKDKGFEIIAFPANNFAGQEPGSNEDIKEFCSLNYDVEFPLMSKISVKGDDMAPIYKWLTTKDMNKVDNYNVSWNFQKFLINPDGSLFMVINPRELPNSKEVIDWLNNKK